MNKVILQDPLGNNAYPITTDSSIVSVGDVIYKGEKVNISDSHRCNITEVGSLLPSTSGKSPQGILYSEDYLYQFYDGGYVDVFSIEDIESGTDASAIRTFTIPNTSGVHFGGVDWLDESNKIFITHNKANNSLYKINIYNESNIVVETIPTPDIPSSVIAHEGIVCYDNMNECIYLTGYLHYDENDASTTRTGLVIYRINPDTGSAVIIRNLPVFHLQDSKFYNGRIFYANDSTVGTASGYNTQRVIVVDVNSGIVSKIIIPNISSIEAEGICIVGGKWIYETMAASSSRVRVNKIQFG